jgi:broad-specificity NMP kinase
MKPIFITGGAGAGKTHLAKTICEGRKTSYISGYQLKASYLPIKKDCEYLIIDNINDSDQLKEAIQLALSDFIELNIKCEPITNISPKVIIVAQPEILQFFDIDSIKNSFNFFAL